MFATDVILQKVRDLGGVKSCMIIGSDGLVIDSVVPTAMDKELVSALATAIYNETDKQSSRFKRGHPEVMVIETDTSMIAIMEVFIDTEKIHIFIDFKSGFDTVQILDSLKGLSKLFGHNA